MRSLGLNFWPAFFYVVDWKDSDGASVWVICPSVCGSFLLAKEYATIISNNGLPDPVSIPDWSRPFIFNGSNFTLTHSTLRSCHVQFIACHYLLTKSSTYFEACACRVYILCTENYHGEYRKQNYYHTSVNFISHWGQQSLKTISNIF